MLITNLNELPQKQNRIQIILEKLSYYPGEQLSGFIYLEVNQVYPNNFVNLQFVGEEYVKFDERMETEGHRMEDDDSGKKVNYTDMKRLLEYNYSVFQFPTPNIHIGSYFFPFTFNLPANLPATFFTSFFNLKDHFLREGSIEYRLTAFLPSPDEKKIPPLCGVEALIINNKGIETKPLDIAIRKPAICYCCCKKGFASIQADLERNSFKIGEESKVNFKINTDELKTTINGVIVSLRQVVMLKTLNGGEAEDYIVVSEEKLQNISSYQLKQGLTVPFKIPPIALQTGKMLYPNSESRLLKSFFTLVVELDTNIHSFCCKVNPSAEFEINVVNDSNALKQNNLNVVEILGGKSGNKPQLMPMTILDTSERHAEISAWKNGYSYGLRQNNAQMMTGPSIPNQRQEKIGRAHV